MIKKILSLLISTLFFTIIIFFLNSYFFNDKNIYNKKSNIKIKEESLILENKNIAKKIQSNYEVKLNLATKIKFSYFPKNFKTKIKTYKNIYLAILESKKFKDKISDIKIEFHEEKPNVRGNMKNKTLRLFGVLNMSKGELISVSLHELGHYIDLYFLKIKEKNDISYKFYFISWEKYKIIKKGQTIKDFVSGYAMSNKYEDFAESFTYYVLHNNDFLEKSKKSKLLKEKYIFFNKYIFKNNYFVGQDFSNKEIKPYYWDITKIEISLENLLQYLKI